MVEQQGELEQGFFLCFVGPAASGKGVITRHLLEKYPEDLSLAVSSTSREPRPGEIEGVHYSFLSREQFKAEIERGAFFEWEETHGNLYGTPQKWIDLVVDAGQRVLLDIDVRGARHFRETFPDHFCGVLLLPPSISVLIERMRARGGVDEAELSVRLETTEREFGDFDKALEEGVFQHVVVNDVMSEAFQTAEDIFFRRRAPLQAEQLEGERRRMLELLAELKAERGER
ncbi:MAG: guanylate kinase [Bdellovibrionales bacterium]|nr:guanylate kinase [Bdellovibrionales bacterium]